MALVSHTRTRSWIERWNTELSDNGEMIKAWCVRLSKEPGIVYCKYCKVKINFSHKGLSALRAHANSRKHMDYGRMYHLKAFKAITCNRAPSGKLNIKPSKKPSLQKTSANHKPSSSSSAASKTIGGGQNRVKLKTKVLGSNNNKNPNPLVNSKHVRHTIIPSVSKKSPVSTLSPKFTVPLLSKKFLQFKTKPSQVPSCSGRQPSSSHSSFQNLQSPLSRLSKNTLSPTSSLRKKPHSSNNNLAFSSPVRQQLQALSREAALTHRNRSSPTPALSLSVGQRLKWNRDAANQVYNGANLRATGPPFLVLPAVKLIPVFICYYCHKEFPSKSSLYEHYEQCTVKLSQKLNDNNSIMTDVHTATSSITTATTTESMKIVTATSSDDTAVNVPTTPTNPKPTPPNVFFSNLTSPQKSLSNGVSKQSLLNSLKLLPIKTALQEQKRMSRKRRNTECENLDWEDDFTPKTACTPPTPKLLISHLSREEYRRELPPHRLFRMSLSNESAWKGDVDSKQVDRDSVDCSQGSRSSSSHATGEESVEKDNKHDGKISVARSLYNVDVTSPLGQFVVRHYKGDPSLHILSDIESHCQTAVPTSTRTTSCTLRTRHDNYPVTFGSSGRRLLYHDYYHSYKFNKEQVREFMRTANTGLNKDSRRLIRQMKKCQVALRYISKADLRHWVSSQNDITVDLKPLSVAEIAYWTSPKPTVSENSVSIFPNGLQSSSPNVKAVLGLRNKREVRIKTVDMLSPSILNISNFISEEACADLVTNRKTIYNSLLSDWSKNNSENVNMSPQTNNNNNNNNNTLQNPNNSVLRRMLSTRLVLGSCLSDNNTLPDITNITMDKDNAAGVSTNTPKLSHDNTASKPRVVIESIPDLKPEGNHRIKNQSILAKHCKDSNVNRSASRPKPSLLQSDQKNSSEASKAKSCDLPDETSSQESVDNLESSGQPSTSYNKFRKSKQPCPKLMGPHSIKVNSPLGFQDILSVEDDNKLLTPFLKHFQYLREKSLSADRSRRPLSKGRRVTKVRKSVGKLEIHSRKRKFLENGSVLNGNINDNDVMTDDETKSNIKNGGSLRLSRDRSLRISIRSRRRKSSPRVTKRVKVGLNRRLSAAGLVKREDSLGYARSRSPQVTERFETKYEMSALKAENPQLERESSSKGKRETPRMEQESSTVKMENYSASMSPQLELYKIAVEKSPITLHKNSLPRRKCTVSLSSSSSSSSLSSSSSSSSSMSSTKKGSNASRKMTTASPKSVSISLYCNGSGIDGGGGRPLVNGSGGGGRRPLVNGSAGDGGGGHK